MRGSTRARSAWRRRHARGRSRAPLARGVWVPSTAARPLSAPSTTPTALTWTYAPWAAGGSARTSGWPRGARPSLTPCGAWRTAPCTLSTTRPCRTTCTPCSPAPLASTRGKPNTAATRSLGPSTDTTASTSTEAPAATRTTATGAPLAPPTTRARAPRCRTSVAGRSLGASIATVRRRATRARPRPRTRISVLVPAPPRAAPPVARNLTARGALARRLRGLCGAARRPPLVSLWHVQRSHLLQVPLRQL